MNSAAIWTDLLSELEAQFDRETYQTWFKNLRLINEDDHTIFLVTTKFNAMIMNKKEYSQDFRRIYRNITGKDKAFVILSEEDVDQTMASPKQSSRSKGSGQTQLNPDFTFDNFVVGNMNQLANAASVAVAQSPGTLYNPLFIYGGVGLGKTHLMHAIGNYIQSKNPDANIIYIPSETFINNYIESLRGNTIEAFRQKYRSADVLLVDDIQFLTAKEQTQDAFFHTFNHLKLANKQIVMTSDRLPHKIKDIEERLVSRFVSGLSADIAPPDYETRVAILKKKAGIHDEKITPEVYDYIAKNIQSNIRELRAILTRVIAYASLVSRPIDLALCKEALSGIINVDKQDIDHHLIRRIICDHFNVTERDLDSSKRTKELVYPRQIAMYLIRDYTDLSLPKIGELFGNRDHSTVVYAYDKITKDSASNPETKATIEALKEKIEEG